MIDTAINEWRNRLHVCDVTVGQSVSQSVKNVNKMCFCPLFRLSNNTTLGKNVIFHWF